MTVEEELRQMAVNAYGSVRRFTIAADIPYSTFLTILERGVASASVANIIKVCKCLRISVDALANGVIEPKGEVDTRLSQLSQDEQRLIECYEEMNDAGKNTILNLAVSLSNEDIFQKSTETMSFYDDGDISDEDKYEMLNQLAREEQHVSDL